MTLSKPEIAAPADTLLESWVHRTPAAIRPYLLLSRFDRPIGFWLLAVPCLIAIALARQQTGFETADILLAIKFAVGSIAMRGAGCTYNDILDRDFDAKVERTAMRPLPSGAVSLNQAWIWLGAQCLIGLVVLLTLSPAGQIAALASIPLVAAYPLMKRITWWPQVWLGLTLNWGFLVAIWLLREHILLGDVLIYIGLVFWTLGYDTIYAVQDKEDDALIGVKSTARLFGDKLETAIWLSYGASIGLVLVGCYLVGGMTSAGVALPFCAHLLAQAHFASPNDGALGLKIFRSNRDACLLLFFGLAVAALIPSIIDFL